MNSTNRSIDPAQGAAELLRRFGMALLGVALPCAAFYSRRAAILMMPIGAILIFLGTVIDPSEPIGARLRSFAGKPGFVIAAALLVWLGATIAWSPFPLTSAERFYNTSGILLVGLAGMAAIPARMRAPALYFLPIGAFAAVLVACLVALNARGVITIGGAPDPVLAVRGAAAMALLVPVALGWLLSRRRAPEAAALAIGAACATFVLGDAASIAIMAIVILAFVLVRVATIPAALLLGSAAALLVVAAPAIPFVLLPIARALGFEETAALMDSLIGIMRREGMRLVTGHGLETTPRAISAGLLPGSDSPPLIIAIWFDLGLMGALAVGALMAQRTKRALEQSADIAAAEIALICAVTAQMLLGVAALQAWWMSTAAAAAIAVRAIAQGQFRTRRPRARLFARSVE